LDWSFRSDQPIYSQLVEKIALGIVSGQLPAGERLKSVRDLAMEAGVNPNTMQRALQELEREGLVFSQRTAGRFVTEDAGVIAGAKKTMAAAQVRAFRAAMEELGYDRDEIIALLAEEREEE